jgi:hypothetical protein
MAALTPTLVTSYDASAGNQKVKIFTVTPEAASDTVALSSYFSTLNAATCYLTSGLDANLTLLLPSVSGTTVTIVQKKADGATNADDWTSASITIIAYGVDEGI